jgi:GAF domain-containing protein
MSMSELPVPSRPPEERADFETPIATLSSRLLAASAEDMDSVVLAGLEDIRLFFRVDHSVLMTDTADGLVVQACHASCGQGVQQVSQGIDLGQLFPWSRRTLVEEGIPVQVDRLDDLPPQAAIDRAGYAGMSVRSSLAVPIFIGRRVAHLIALQTVSEDRAWTAGHVARLRLLGETLVDALERARACLARESERRATVAADSEDAGDGRDTAGAGGFQE